MAKQTFTPIFYEEGDTVIDRHNAKAEPQKIIRTQFATATNYEYQIIYFESNPNDFHVANHFAPYGDTIEKYKDVAEQMKDALTVVATKPKTRTTQTTTKIDVGIPKFLLNSAQPPIEKRNDVTSDCKEYIQTHSRNLTTIISIFLCKN